MPEPIAYQDAIDLLDADHKAVKKLFIDFNALCEDGAPAAEKQALAEKICLEISVHAQLEEEIFYPAVRQATGDDPLLDEAVMEHAEAKDLIAQIQGMDAGDAQYDATVKELGKDIDHHVLEERERIFMKAKLADLDLRGMVPALVERKEELKQQMLAAAGEAA